MPDLLVRAAKVLADDKANATAVLIRDGVIAAIDRWEELSRAEVAQVIDLSQLVLSPGFIDTHVHITGSGQRSAPADMMADPPETLLLRAAANAQAALGEGLTTVRDCGGRNDVIFPFKDAANRGILPAPRVLAAGAPLTRTGGHGHWWGLEADDDDEIRKFIRRQAKANADVIKVMVDGGIDLTNHQPGLLYFDPSTLRMIVDEAERWGRRVAAHCLTTAGIRSATFAGVHSIEHAIFYDLDAGATRYDQALGDDIARKGIVVDPGHAFAYDVFTDPSAATIFPRNAAMFHDRLEDDARMLRQGVKQVPGTDGGWYATPFGYYHRIPSLMVERTGMTLRQAWEACTRVAAESIGLERETGSIATGKRADLVALGSDPTADVGAYTNVRWTMVAGRILYDRTT